MTTSAGEGRLATGVAVAEAATGGPMAVSGVAPPMDAHSDVGALGSMEEPIAAGRASILEINELIEMSIKPSRWFVALVSARFIGLCLLLAAGIWYGARATGGWSQASSLVFSGLLLAALGRAVVASLQWASRLYLLTNRRAIRFSGVLEVQMTEAALARVADAQLVRRPIQRFLGLGTIRVLPAGDRGPAVTWDHVSRPVEIHEKLLRAIQRARSGP